jgi:hypothetical protein
MQLTARATLRHLTPVPYQVPGGSGWVPTSPPFDFSDHLRAAWRRHDPLGESLAHVGEDVSQPPVFRLLPLDYKPRAAERSLNCLGGCFNAMYLIGEQVHVLGRAADDPVRQQRVPAAEREPARQ